MSESRIKDVGMRAAKGTIVGGGQFEQMLARLLQADFSAGTEAFHDELLVRCLMTLDADSCDGTLELDDADLGLLFAAGDMTSATRPCIGDNGL